MRLTLHQFLTLDGVSQAPGGPHEDREGGFEHGGWQTPYRDPEGGATVVGWFGQASAFLLGRKTYEIFSNFWPTVTDSANPIASKLNSLPKYVASTTLSSVNWDNSSLLGGDIAAEVAELKKLPGDELQMHGNGGLAQTMIEHDLIDEYRLVYFPVHVGSGKKLFRDGAPGGSPATGQHSGHPRRRHHRLLRASRGRAARLISCPANRKHRRTAYAIKPNLALPLIVGAPS